MNTYKAAPDVDVVTSTATITGFGNLAINAFVIDAVRAGACRHRCGEGTARTSWPHSGP